MSEDARTRRLRADNDKVAALATRSGGLLVVESTQGVPPVRYVLRVRCASVEHLNGEQPVRRSDHLFEIKIPSGYPLQAPYVRLLSRVFHPHVFENGQVCLGSRWQVGEGLDNLIMRVFAILRFDPSYLDFASPANPLAAEWARKHLADFPLQPDPFGTPIQAPPDPRRVEWADPG